MSRDFLELAEVVLILAIGGLAVKTWSVCGMTAVLAIIVLANSARTAELGFPENCVELLGVPPQGLQHYTFSARDSVLFATDRSHRVLKEGEPLSFIAWNTQTGKRLAKLPAPDPFAHLWKFSPDGTLLAIPIESDTKMVQLWEVGMKDVQGVPALRLIARLHQRNYLANELRGNAARNASLGDFVRLVWSHDSKTLLAATGSETTADQILFWSYTDKPNVWADPTKDDPETTKWKPWAKLEFDNRVLFDVSRDNQSLVVIKNGRLGEGQFFELATAKLREEFQVHRRTKLPHGGQYRPQLSGDGKTLAISDYRYLALWDTALLAPRVEIENPEFLNFASSTLGKAVFTQDSRWLLTIRSPNVQDQRRHTGGLLQFREIQRGELRKEVAFPKELGQFDWIETLPDGRVMTRFTARKQNQEFDIRYFLWHDADLLRYAAEHSSAPSPKPKAD